MHNKLDLMHIFITNKYIFFIEIIFTSYHRALSYMRLTNGHPGKNIREVLLKPLPTFGRLGHILAILCTRQYRISRCFTMQTSYLCINMLIINICLTICTYLCRQRAHCRERDILLSIQNENTALTILNVTKKKGSVPPQYRTFSGYFESPSTDPCSDLSDESISVAITSF